MIEEVEVEELDPDEIDLGEIVAPPGASAFEIAVAHGFVGTEAEWLASLGGAGGGAVFTVATPSASWIVPHSFARLPSVDVYLSGVRVLADVAATTTVVTVTFAIPKTGQLVLT